MPHVAIKIYAGRSEAQKQRIADDVAAALESNGIPERSISVSIEDVAPVDWVGSVYNPEIRDKPERIYKKPGYAPGM